MKRLKTYKKKNKNTIVKFIIIVFFCVSVNSFILFKFYSDKLSSKVIMLVQEKLDKIIYLFFSDLITDDIINKESVSNILEIQKNKQGELITVNYNLEKTYKILTDVSKVLKKGINDLENGKIDVLVYDNYLESYKNNLVLNIPLFLGSNNIFLNNMGPLIPVKVNFSETLLTNIKTKVTDYGFNNALLEIYITVEMEKLIITPLKKDDQKFYYDILIGAMVVNGKVPEFYGGSYEKMSNIFDIPIT